MSNHARELQDHYEFHDGIAVIDFVGDHCAPCVAFAPAFLRNGKEVGRIFGTTTAAALKQKLDALLS